MKSHRLLAGESPVLVGVRLPWLNFISSFLEQTTSAVETTASGDAIAAHKALLAQVTPLNAFLIGYSLDSIVELFGTSMEGASQVKSLARKGE